jgi:hypothetical protein
MRPPAEKIFQPKARSLFPISEVLIPSPKINTVFRVIHETSISSLIRPSRAEKFQSEDRPRLPVIDEFIVFPHPEPAVGN